MEVYDAEVEQSAFTCRFWYLMASADGGVTRDRQDLSTRVLDWTTVLPQRYLLLVCFIVSARSVPVNAKSA